MFVIVAQVQVQPLKISFVHPSPPLYEAFLSSRQTKQSKLVFLLYRNSRRWKSAACIKPETIFSAGVSVGRVSVGTSPSLINVSAELCYTAYVYRRARHREVAHKSRLQIRLRAVGLKSCFTVVVTLLEQHPSGSNRMVHANRLHSTFVMPWQGGRCS